MVDIVEEQINFMIDDIDVNVAGKYPFKLRDMLEHPLDYRERPTILAELEKLKDDVTDYFKKRKDQVSDATKLYSADAAKASKIAEKVSDAVASSAKSAKKPVISPLTFARNEENDEIIFIDKFDDAAYSKMVDALIGNSLFVVDSSLEIDGFKVGRWVFPDLSGKNRALYVSFPINPAGALDIARDQMIIALDAVKTEIITQLSIEGKGPVIGPKPSVTKR